LPIVSNVRLRSLDVSSTRAGGRGVTDATIVRLAQFSGPVLRELFISGCAGVSDVALLELASQ
jgi:hypothetical protein